jgi:hypothetical protein
MPTSRNVETFLLDLINYNLDVDCEKKAFFPQQFMPLELIQSFHCSIAILIDFEQFDIFAVNSLRIFLTSDISELYIKLQKVF